jgi:hypothetical protein
LQAGDTTVVNSSGLDADGQLSSAYDLALIARACMQRPDFRKYVATRNARFPAREKGKTFAINNQNELLTDYPGAIGIKTGYTTLAKNTFVAAATRSSRTLLVVVMHGKHGIHKEAAKLLDWGFANAKVVEPVGVLVGPAPQHGAAGPGVDPRAAGVPGGHASDETQLRRLTDQPTTTLAAAAGFLLLLILWVGFAVRRGRRRRAMEAELAHLAALRTALNAERERLYDVHPAPVRPPTGHLVDPHPPDAPPRRHPTAGEQPLWDGYPTGPPRTAPPPIGPPRTAPPRMAPPLGRPPTASPPPLPPDDERHPPRGRYR